jgi:uncharacterized protein
MAAPQRLYDGFLPGLHPIDAYGSGGFRFGGMSHRGSILALPSGVRKWEAEDLGGVTGESLAPLIAETDAIDIVLFGWGGVPGRLANEISLWLAGHGLRFEAMSTSSAAMTYNVLIAEKRRVAAALVAAP